MRKLKLLFAACALMLGGSTASAQTDVTSQYITNAGFESTTPEETNWAAGESANSADYASTGWELSSSAAWSSSAVVAYGGAGQVNGVSAPSTDNLGNSGNALGVSVGWSGIITYKSSSVTLPAGTYTLSAAAYNNLPDVTQFQSKLGFVANSASYISTKNSYTYGSWDNDEVTFTLFEETEGYFQIGGGAISGGSGANAKVFFDNISLTRSDISYPVDMTARINNWDFVGCSNNNFPGWTIYAPNGGNTWKNGDSNVEYWIGTAANGVFDYYQTVTKLPAGKYTLSASMWNSENGEGKGGSVNGNAGVYGTSNGVTVFAGVTTESDAGSMSTYTTDEINVLDGTLRLGVKNNGTMGARWFGVDWIKLTLVAGPDLSDYVAAYEQALSNAQAVDQSATMAPSLLSVLQNAISTYGDVDKTSINDLIEATDALNTATANANTSIASYAIIATGVIPDNSLEGWTCENSNTFHINTWSVEGNPGNDPSNMVTPFIENWVGKGSYLGAGKVYYRLEGLEPGEVYYASALVRSYNEANSDAPNGPNFYINNVVTDLATDGTTFTYNGMSGIYATLGGTATIGEDGILELGVVINEDRNYNWVAFKNVRMQELAAAYNTAVAAAQALEGTIPTDAYAAVESALATYSEVSVANIENINALVETYSALVAPYAAFNALKAKAQSLQSVANDNSSANEDLGNVISTATNDVAAAANVEEINTVTSTLKGAMATYVGAANPVGDGAKFDCTFMLTNPDLTPFYTGGHNVHPAGWATEQEDGNYQVIPSEDAANPDGIHKYCYEYWSENPKENSKFNLYTPVTLPEGTYTMSCYAFAAQPINGDNCAVYFYANDTQGGLVSDAKLTQKSISFVNDTEQEVKIGLKPLTGNTYRWMGIGYVELYKVPAKTYTVSEDADYDNSQEGAGKVTLNRTIKVGINTVVLPFSMTQSEVENYFGEGSKVYALSSFADDNISFITKEEGISANLPVLLDAKSAGNSYEIKDRTIVAGTPTTSVSGLEFIGTYAASLTVPQDENSYIINGGYIYLVDSEVTLKGTRAYFHTENAGARVLTLSFDGETTGIVSLKNGKLNIEKGDIYDLSGRRVETLKKGIYVLNGKKIVK